MPIHDGVQLSEEAFRGCCESKQYVPTTREDRIKAAKMLANHDHPIIDIAQAFNVTVRTIKRWLKS